MTITHFPWTNLPKTWPSAPAGFGRCARKETPIPEPPAPKVEGDRIILPPMRRNSPPSPSKPPSREPSRSATHRPAYWNEDTTVRVFTPVAGRVKPCWLPLAVSLGPGAPLAEIDSPDFGQALAAARTAVGNLAAADKSVDREPGIARPRRARAKGRGGRRGRVYTAALAERDRADGRNRQLRRQHRAAPIRSTSCAPPSPACWLKKTSIPARNCAPT